MEMRTIGSLTVSAVGLGGNNFSLRIGRAETDAVVGAALDHGITLIDTSDEYGDSEEYLSTALGPRRDQIVLATKFGRPFREQPGGASPSYIRIAVENSLRRLNTDRIDLYQLHVPDPTVPIADTLGALTELVTAGKVREIGCSNFDGAMLAEADAAVSDGAPGFASVQNLYNVLQREAEDEVLSYCDRTGTAFLPYFPLASGILTGKYRAGEPPPEGTRMADWAEFVGKEMTLERMATVDALATLAKEEGHTVLDLAIAWLLAHPAVVSVIAGATSPAQVTANVTAGSWALRDDVMARVDALAPR
jgi:aryl-alcohol dehydrogenase-like predicted oxidoreductase